VKISDTVVGAGFVAAGAAIVAGTAGFPTLEGGHPGPSLFPRLVGGLMALFGATLALQGFRARDVGEPARWRERLRSAGFVNALFVLGGVLAYIGLADRLGFLVMGALVLFVLMWRLAVGPLKALVVAIAFNTLVYVLFVKLLRVPLPLGVVWF
jgi:putative tricarboxylic transport membrane protein